VSVEVTGPLKKNGDEFYLEVRDYTMQPELAIGVSA
jgi:hypothetical protein